jgi:hypothetical protein
MSRSRPIKGSETAYPQKQTLIPRAACLDGGSEKPTSVSEGNPRSRARPVAARRPTAGRPLTNCAACSSSRPSLKQGERPADVPAPKAKNPETAPPQKLHLKVSPTTTLWHRHIGSVFAGTPLGGPKTSEEVTRSETSRPNEGPRRPRLRAWPCPLQPPSPKPAGRTPSCCRPHRRPSAHRRSW